MKKMLITCLMSLALSSFAEIPKTLQYLSNGALVRTSGVFLNWVDKINSVPVTSYTTDTDVAEVVAGITADSIGLGDVDNTSDENKPVSTAVQTALNLKATVVALTSHETDTDNPHEVTKTQVGLGNCDNTSDVNKPVSTAVQTALNLKANSSDTATDTELAAHTSRTDNPHEVTKTQVGLGNVDNLKNNLMAVTAPTVSDDVTADYAIGSRWVDTVTDKTYTCVDADTGVAIWTEGGGGGGGGGHIIQDNGVPVTVRANLNIKGFKLSDDEANDATVLEFPDIFSATFTSSNSDTCAWTDDSLRVTHGRGTLTPDVTVFGEDDFTIELPWSAVDSEHIDIDFTAIGGKAAVSGSWSVIVSGPNGGSGGSGDMTKAVYDTDNDGKVNSSESADAIAGTPGNSQYYGTNSSGTKGFYALPSGGLADVVAKSANYTFELSDCDGTIYANVGADTDVTYTMPTIASGSYELSVAVDTNFNVRIVPGASPITYSGSSVNALQSTLSGSCVTLRAVNASWIIKSNNTFTPISPYAWFAASDLGGADGSSVSSWYGNVARTIIASQSTGSYQPTLNTGANGIGGANALTFDGTGDRLAVNAQVLPSNGVFTLFCVAKVAHASARKILVSQFLAGATYRAVFGYNSSADGSASSGTFAPWANGATVNAISYPNDTAHILMIRSNGASGGTVQVNNGATVSCVFPGIYAANTVLGTNSAGEDLFSGKIAEFIVFTSYLSAADVATIKSQLASKYSITL